MFFKHSNCYGLKDQNQNDWSTRSLKEIIVWKTYAANH